MEPINLLDEAIKLLHKAVSPCAGTSSDRQFKAERDLLTYLAMEHGKEGTITCSARKIAYAAIDGERDYQDAMKVGPDGRTDGRQKSVGDYLTLIRTYSNKADAAYAGRPGDTPALHEIRKIAAIAVQCLEVHGSPLRGTE